MKKMLLATARNTMCRMCSTNVLYPKQTGGSSTKEAMLIISSFLELGEENCPSAAKICGGAENVVKTETQQTAFVNGLLGFISTGIYTPLEALCVLLTIIA